MAAAPTCPATTANARRVPRRRRDHEVRLHRGQPQLRRRPPPQVLAGRAGRRSERRAAPAPPRDPARHRASSAGVEISSMADIPAGTGLGSSGAFTVGALQALRAHRHEHPSNVELAELACHDRDRPARRADRQAGPVHRRGRRHHRVLVRRRRRRRASRHSTSRPRRVHRLEDNLMLFYTGIRRSASDVLAIETAAASAAHRRDSTDEPRRGQGARSRRRADALERGDLERFGALLTEQWERKLERSPDRGARAGRRLDPRRASTPARPAASSSARAMAASSSSTPRRRPDLREVDGGTPGSTRCASASTTSGATVIVAE